MINRLALLVVLTLSACAPSQQTIQTAIAETQAAIPTATATAMPTSTPQPTATTAPTATAAASLTEVRQKVIDAVNKSVSSMDDVESVNLMRFDGGRLIVELRTAWASQDRQPDVSYLVARMVGQIFGLQDRRKVEIVAGGPFMLDLTTYSTRGEYRYNSVSDWDTLRQLAAMTISHDEWVMLSHAGFK